MGKAILYCAGIVGATVVTYLLMAASWGAVTSIVDVSVAAMNATSNLTALPGIEAGVSGFPVYAWAIPGLLCLVTCTILLKRAGGKK